MEDERAPPLTEPAAEGKSEGHAHPHLPPVVRASEVLGAERRGSHLPPVLQGTEEAEVVAVDAVVALRGGDPQKFVPRPTGLDKADAGVVLYLRHHLPYDPPVLLQDGLVPPVVDHVVRPVPQLGGEGGRPVHGLTGVGEGALVGENMGRSEGKNY